MSKVTPKTYYCPVCGNEETHSTNHYGEIYCHCRKCGNNVLYCKEKNMGKPEAECRIMFYRFDISKTDDKQAYKDLKKELKRKGYKVFNTISVTHESFEALRKHNGTIIGLYKVKQWDNQIVSTIGRVFYWFEAIWPNKDIKSGYYLVFEEVLA